MSYILERFGSLTLPVYNPISDLGALPLDAPVTNLPDGGYDYYGTDVAPMKAGGLEHYGTIINGSQLVQVQFDALKAVIGQRARLTRRGIDAVTQWNMARLLKVSCQRTIEDIQTLDVQLGFSLSSPIWRGLHHGATWYLDSGKYLDYGLVLDMNESHTLTTSPQNVSIANSGNYPVSDVVLTITAGSSNITALDILITGVCQLTYTGTITSGQSLVLDCGARSVLNNGADDYSHLARGAGHVISSWMRFAPGSNTVQVTTTGGGTGSTILVEFDEGWA